MNKIVMLAGLSAVLCQLSCTQTKEKKEEESTYTVTSPLVSDTSFTKEYVSQIKSVRNIELRAQEKGFCKTFM
ncbi:hypothetical protein [Mucilaginibacter antarcticus]|uniref:hypothetical protein n=1 Tax=Mucilaginibacter antarcticus TaxID=1855725 RepID=UPI0036429D95